MPHILIIEDDTDINNSTAEYLRRKGCLCSQAFSGTEGRLLWQAGGVDLLLVDLMLPGLSGSELIREIRWSSRAPVIVLSAKTELSDKVGLLGLGADDYLVKPFAFDELLARIRAMTRKRAGNRKNQFSIADLTVDIERRTVFRGGKEITLIPKEFSLLECLIRNQGVVLSREQLENQIWNYEFSGSSNNIDVYISRLRKKIDAGNQPRLLHTIRGVGWVLKTDEARELS